jgi:hypothetical protein
MTTGEPSDAKQPGRNEQQADLTYVRCEEASGEGEGECYVGSDPLLVYCVNRRSSWLAKA